MCMSLNEDKTIVYCSKVKLSSIKLPSALIKSYSVNELCNVVYSNRCKHNLTC